MLTIHINSLTHPENCCHLKWIDMSGVDFHLVDDSIRALNNYTFDTSARNIIKMLSKYL